MISGGVSDVIFSTTVISLEVIMKLEEKDYREIFALFTASTRTEREQVYDNKSEHFYENVNLDKVYDVSMECREFALDAWRAVLTHLKRKGFKLAKDGRISSLGFIDDEYVDA
jgi:hypothetical protein